MERESVTKQIFGEVGVRFEELKLVIFKFDEIILQKTKKMDDDLNESISEYQVIPAWHSTEEEIIEDMKGYFYRGVLIQIFGEYEFYFRKLAKAYKKHWDNSANLENMKVGKSFLEKELKVSSSVFRKELWFELKVLQEIRNLCAHFIPDLESEFIQYKESDFTKKILHAISQKKSLLIVESNFNITSSEYLYEAIDLIVEFFRILEIDFRNREMFPPN